MYQESRESFIRWMAKQEGKNEKHFECFWKGEWCYEIHGSGVNLSLLKSVFVNNLMNTQ